MDFEFVKQLYFRELDGRFQQDSRINIYIGLLSVIGGIVAVLFQRVWPGIVQIKNIQQQNLGFSSAPLEQVWNSQNIFIVLCFIICIAAVFACVAAVIFLFRAVIGHHYELLSPTTNLLQHFNVLSEYYTQYPNPDITPQKDFQTVLTQKMAEATTRNVKINTIRSARYYRVSQCLAWAISLIFLAGILLAFKTFNEIFKII
jgi:hypothetical protein